MGNYLFWRFFKAFQLTVTALCRTGIHALSLGWPDTAKLVIV